MCLSGTAFGPSLQRLGRVGMGFHEQARDADGNGGTRQHRHHLALAARARALAAGQLHRVRGIEHHRARRFRA